MNGENRGTHAAHVFSRSLKIKCFAYYKSFNDGRIKNNSEGVNSVTVSSFGEQRRKL